MAVYTLPDLPYDYGALEPAMSGQILGLHHDKHHAAYVKGANDTLEQLAGAGDRGRARPDRRPGEDAGVQPVRPRAALDLLEEPLARRR